MVWDNRIDFGPIRSDYAFFIAHTTETVAQAAHLVPQINWLFGRAAPQRFLDFGCGTGESTERLLRQSCYANPKKPDLTIYLIEPVKVQLAESVERLAPFASKIEALDSHLNSPMPETMDLILANHSLYYVPDISRTLQTLFNALRPGGQFVVALLDASNLLAGIWRSAYQMIEKPFPFPLADNAENFFRTSSIPYQRDIISYQVSFPDSAEAKLRILRFLVGPALQDVLEEQVLSLFDPYCADGLVTIDTSYPHLVVTNR